jgi:hypothetical protein
MLKNTVFKSGNHALGLPSGASATRPDAVVNGQTRYNTDTGKIEFYNASTWNAVAREGNVTITRTLFTGNSSILQYGPLNNTYSGFGTFNTGPNYVPESQAIVFVNTVYQIPGTNYRFAANISNSALTDIVFTSVTNSAVVAIIENLGSTTV